jgi:hypothetical protein
MQDEGNVTQDISDSPGARKQENALWPTIEETTTA